MAFDLSMMPQGGLMNAGERDMTPEQEKMMVLGLLSNAFTNMGNLGAGRPQESPMQGLLAMQTMYGKQNKEANRAKKLQEAFSGATVNDPVAGYGVGGNWSQDPATAQFMAQQAQDINALGGQEAPSIMPEVKPYGPPRLDMSKAMQNLMGSGDPDLMMAGFENQLKLMPEATKPQLVTVYENGQPVQKWLRPGEADGVQVGMGNPGKSTWQDGGDRLYEMDGSGQPTGKTLPKAMQPNMQFVQGGDYKPSGVFNPITGQFTPTDAPDQTPYVQPDPMAPWANMPPKKADDMKARLYPNESKKLDDLRDQVAKGESLMRDLERFGELNRTQATGGAIDRAEFLPTFDEQKREMEAISARLAPQARPAGSGTTSDRDLALYLQGLPGIDKPGSVNANIRTQYAKNIDEAKQKLDFAERYFAERGHLNGWQSAWEKNKIPSTPATESEAETIRTMRANGSSDAEIAATLNRKQSKAKPVAAFDLPPNAKKYEGKTLRDTKSGKRFKSVGGKWVEVK